MKHIIISRVNMPRELDPSNHVRPAPYKEPGWNEKRIELLNEYTRPSLRQQTCQDFEFVTLWGDHHPFDREQALPNESQYIISRGIDERDEAAFDFKQWRKDPRGCEKLTMDFAFQIRDILRENYQAPLLITNLDSDDCLKYNFVEILQRYARKFLRQGKAPLIIDIHTRYLMHVETGGQGVKYRRTPSPATSSLETEIECYPLRWHHSMMLDYLPKGVGFTRINQLAIMQTISDTNILTRGKGENATFDTKKFF